MAFSRVNPPGWSIGDKLTSAQMNALDINVSNAVDGAAGGTYSAPLTWGGAHTFNASGTQTYQSGATATYESGSTERYESGAALEIDDGATVALEGLTTKAGNNGRILDRIVSGDDYADADFDITPAKDIWKRATTNVAGPHVGKIRHTATPNAANGDRVRVIYKAGALPSAIIFKREDNTPLAEFPAGQSDLWVEFHFVSTGSAWETTGWSNNTIVYA